MTPRTRTVRYVILSSVFIVTAVGAHIWRTQPVLAQESKAVTREAVRALVQGLEQQVEVKRTELQRVEASLARAQATLKALDAAGRQSPTEREPVLDGLRAEQEALTLAIDSLRLPVLGKEQRGASQASLATYRRLSEALTEVEIRLSATKEKGER